MLTNAAVHVMMACIAHFYDDNPRLGAWRSMRSRDRGPRRQSLLSQRRLLNCHSNCPTNAMYSLDGRAWQEYEAEYPLPVTTATAAAATPADVTSGPSEPALILSLDEGSVECR